MPGELAWAPGRHARLPGRLVVREAARAQGRDGARRIYIMASAKSRHPKLYFSRWKSLLKNCPTRQGDQETADSTRHPTRQYTPGDRAPFRGSASSAYRVFVRQSPPPALDRAASRRATGEEQNRGAPEETAIHGATRGKKHAGGIPALNRAASRRAAGEEAHPRRRKERMPILRDPRRDQTTAQRDYHEHR